MEDKIRKLLQSAQPLKAKDIANRLGFDRGRVSSLLHMQKSAFEQDEQYRWFLKSSVLRITFPETEWLTTDQFESTLCAVDSPLESSHTDVLIQFAKQTSLLIDTIARLLALCNQLAAAGKSVKLDLANCRNTRTYLDRVGFFDQLDSDIVVLPNRPSTSSAATYRGSSDKMLEVVAIDLKDPRDDSILRGLRERLDKAIVSENPVRAHTILGELFDNIHEHSSSPIPGFAALQVYGKGPRPNIRTVFSDSGAGIVGTLRPTLTREQILSFERSGKDPRVALIEYIFSHGKLSRFDAAKSGRGLGLKRAGELANQFNNSVKGSITVRQDTFEVTIQLHSDRFVFSHRLNLHKLSGTHICFNMFLTN